MSDETRPGDDETGGDDNSDSPPDFEELPEVANGDIPPGEVDRTFSLLEEAVINDEVESDQLDRLLSILEGTIATPSDTDPEAVAELLSLLEGAIIEPKDIDDVDLDGLLSVLESAVSGATTADDETLEELFDFIGEGMADPASINPENIERFRENIEDAIVDVTDPAAGSIGRLFPIPGLTAVDPEEIDDEGAVDMFRIARIGAAMTQRATGYSVESGIRTGTRMAYAAATAESAADLLTESRAVALDELQRAGIDIGDERVDWLEAHEEAATNRRPITRETLRDRGTEILSKSAEIGRDETLHPAFPSILDQLAADEARILRLLATKGRQPTMDVRDKQFLPFKSKLVAENLTMTGSDAGCRYPDRTAIYLQNLERLGLIDFSAEPVENLKRYQVLEAQTHIEDARDSAKRPKTVYGSVKLTDFGIDFCETCMPFEVDVGRRATDFRRDAE